MDWQVFIGLALIITLAPWVAVSFFGWRVGARLVHDEMLGSGSYNSRHLLLLSAGLAGCLAYTALGLIAWCLSLTSVPHPLLVAVVACVLVCALLGYRTNVAYESPRVGVGSSLMTRTWGSWLTLLYAFLVAAVPCYLMWQTPLHGWDVLDYWGPQTAVYVEQCVTNANASFSTSYLQPPVWLIAVTWGGCAQDFVGLQPSLSLSFKIICAAHYVSALLVIIAWALHKTGSSLVATICYFTFITTPLVTNHMVLVGYAEPVLGCILLAASVVTALGLRHGKERFVILGWSIAALMIVVKNIGVLFVSSLVLVTIFISVRSNSRLVLAATIATLYTLFVVGEMPAISMPIGGGTLRYDPIEHVVWLGYRAMEVSTNSIAIFFDNFFHAHIFNASFGIAFLIAFLALACSLFDHVRGMRVSDDIFLELLFFASLCMVACIQLLDYGLKVSLPGQDTGLTRFSLPSYFLVPLVVTNFFLRGPSMHSCRQNDQMEKVP